MRLQTKRMIRSLAALFLFALLMDPVNQACAQTQSFRAEYSVTLLGLPVAKARFDSTFTGDRFSIEGSLASSGVARLFDKTTGTTRVEGAIGRDRVEPHAFSSSYRSGKKRSRTTIRYAGDAVSSVDNTPEPRKGRNWVPVEEGHLRSVLDPLSSTLIRTSDPAKVCNRTVRVFDGEMRADLKLSPRSAGQGRIVCNARFVPVAGYRKGRKQIEFLKNESRIAVTFARLGDTGFYAPVDASVGTQIGTLRITASRIVAR